MSFISPEFIIFASVVLPLYFLTPLRVRWVLLIVASYLFYAYGNVQYLPLIALSTIVDYTAARRIAATDQPVRRRLWLIVSLTTNLGILFSFKYFNFFNQSLGAGLGAVGINYVPIPLDVVLPIGISFYTFQTMSYTIDVYRGVIQPEKNLGVVATFVSFFPQLVAGPIERAGNLLPQFRTEYRFDTTRAVEGLRQILWGFFKKVVIADRLAIYVNVVYNDVESHSGLTLLIATLFFGFQIYCDFSAYSDIAIGTARIMGIDLMENFRQPFLSKSVREFWNRWHISLSAWFRDYVYIPLGGSRVSLARNLLNLLIVFVVSGLWHGAGWTFILWGFLHGLWVVGETALDRLNIRLLPFRSPFLSWALTFAFITFTWVFFRSNDMGDVFYVLRHLFVFDPTASVSAPFEGALLGAQNEFVLSWVLVAFLMAADWLIARRGLDGLLTTSPALARWAVYYALGAAVVFSGLYGLGAQEFIYFQF
jgi:D-alanyl-lipoteichoic acid acyltransferase DltB (MBOAT superfamily)